MTIREIWYEFRMLFAVLSAWASLPAMFIIGMGTGAILLFIALMVWPDDPPPPPPDPNRRFDYPDSEEIKP